MIRIMQEPDVKDKLVPRFLVRAHGGNEPAYWCITIYDAKQLAAKLLEQGASSVYICKQQGGRYVRKP